MTTRVFVYGTLLSGEANHGALDGSTLVEPHATLHGARLFFATSLFPGIVPGDERAVVHGEVYEVDDDMLRRLDWLEGFYADDETQSMYVRRDVNGVQAYFWNRGTPTEADLIPSGDWRQRRLV